MSVYKVERKVDTVIIEMDVSVAEKLLEVLFLVQDNTSAIGLGDMGSLRYGLVEDAMVRYPSPLYIAEPKIGYTLLRNTTGVELDARHK